ncbi:NOP56 [Lepeophtheirus salmonis]|uniref:Nucleolar protein 56 n=1 Tax=Lepeophtheirus salmonis TaxID=72036 RepID=A0A7R8CU75_LEPSM|nr:NOP56 [Lepeophtheirus salmonis]CAF2882123.1 NOP56 [Lepeophtheirus salmonis]
MSVQFALFEHASGYGLFKVKEFEEIGVFPSKISEVEASLSDVSSFNKIVSLASFLPFKTAGDALNNINAVSEGIATDDAKLFVKTHLPKKKGVVSHVGVVPEVIRGIRHHFAKLVKGMNAEASKKSQLGLGHSYSRAKVKFNVHKADNMIIQSIALLDQLDKDVNTFAMRIREWYSYHFPELIKIVNDNYTFARCVKVVKNRKEINDETLEKLEAVLMDSGKAKAIIEASKSSMGMDISIIDLMHIEQFADRVIGLAEYRKELSVYLQKKMESVAPNLATLIGDSVAAARLISHAGSLTNLAKYPASTVQILGAEKALFRALKTKGNTPKYGLIFHSSFIGKAGAKNKGRISRYLANKCSIASRIDCFSEIPTDVFGKKLKEQVEDRLKFYETGEIPKKNIEVMQEAIQAVKEEADSFKVVKKDKKKKKRKAEEMENEEEVKVKEEVDSPKKKKRKVVKEEENTAEDESEAVTPKNKKKKKSKKKESDD